MAVEVLGPAGNLCIGFAERQRVVAVGTLSTAGTGTVGAAAEKLENFVADLSVSAGNYLKRVLNCN